MTQEELERIREGFKAVGINPQAADAWQPLADAAKAAGIELYDDDLDGDDADKDGDKKADTLRIDGIIQSALVSDELSNWSLLKGTCPESVANFLEQADGGDVTILINSPGGDYFGGADIATQLLDHEGKVTVKIIGEAASAASLIAAAADTVEISPLAQVMIHGASVITYGNATTHREQAERLDKIGKSAASIYESRCAKKTVKEWLFDGKDHWLTADEAVSAGFADTKTPIKKKKGAKGAKAADADPAPTAAADAGEEDRARAIDLISASEITQATMLLSFSKSHQGKENQL